ncbi:DUF1800 family protein [Mycobacterium sp.]|uniref:DUF1800 family protein n=1 Tax=Mycobacterium sp. TaxID=1785 RepID=UPI003BAE3AB5
MMSGLSEWWLRRMIAVQQPVHEKLTLLWHNHFATLAKKAGFPSEMAAQNQTLRKLSLGDFGTLAYAMLTDAAMRGRPAELGISGLGPAAGHRTPDYPSWSAPLRGFG